MKEYNIKIMLNPLIADPQGLSIKRILENLGHDIQDVRVGKYITIKTESDSEVIKEICDKVLHNPVMEQYKVEVNE